MTDFMTPINGGKATFREYLTQPTFAEELENYILSGNDTGLHDHVDLDYFLDRVLIGHVWEDDKLSLGYLADHLSFYGKFFRELHDLAPEYALTPEQLKEHAEAVGELLKARIHASKLEADLRSKWEHLNAAA